MISSSVFVKSDLPPYMLFSSIFGSFLSSSFRRIARLPWGKKELPLGRTFLHTRPSIHHEQNQI